ncbi:hypothetical protein NQ318_016715 [Aromia moschata]|uniref:Uncharacterized protein n=1 Tax=Aromia moschata TaxID=1265417 RepID=A0AAV8XGW4_9CUCU|nr:hypothetical protein NQ318_016715 [Aromia moschata]
MLLFRFPNQNTERVSEIDIHVIRLQYKVGKVLGLTPICLQKNNRLVFYSKAYSFVLFTLFFTLTVFTFYIRLNLYKEITLLEVILDVFECLSELILISLCLLGNTS